MTFSSALLAVEHRLLGAPREHIPALSHLPRPADEWERALGVTRPTVAIENALRGPDGPAKGHMTVPVIYRDVRNKDWKTIYPSIVYNFTAFAPRFRDWKQTSDKYPVHHPTRMVPSTRPGDDKGPALYARRPPAEPWDMTLEVRCYSDKSEDHDLELSLISRYVLRTIRARDFLRVPHNDGGFRSWKAHLVEAAIREETQYPIISGGTLDVETCFSITYVIEGYLDSSDLEQLLPTIRKVSVTVSPTK